MNKMLLAALFVTASFGTQAASKFDTYECWGKNTKLVLVMDWFGSGVEQSVNGTYMGKKISYKPIQGYHPRKLDPKYEYSFYQDPNSPIYVRMVNPGLTTIDDPSYFGKLFIDGQQVDIECLNPAPTF